MNESDDGKDPTAAGARILRWVKRMTDDPCRQWIEEDILASAIEVEVDGESQPVPDTEGDTKSERSNGCKLSDGPPRSASKFAAPVRRDVRSSVGLGTAIVVASVAAALGTRQPERSRQEKQVRGRLRLGKRRGRGTAPLPRLLPLRPAALRRKETGTGGKAVVPNGCKLSDDSWRGRTWRTKRSVPP